jgi:hypothetical protein
MSNKINLNVNLNKFFRKNKVKKTIFKKKNKVENFNKLKEKIIKK